MLMYVYIYIYIHMFMSTGHPARSLSAGGARPYYYYYYYYLYYYFYYTTTCAISAGGARVPGARSPPHRTVNRQYAHNSWESLTIGRNSLLMGKQFKTIPYYIGRGRAALRIARRTGSTPSARWHSDSNSSSNSNSLKAQGTEEASESYGQFSYAQSTY